MTVQTTHFRTIRKVCSANQPSLHPEVQSQRFAPPPPFDTATGCTGGTPRHANLHLSNVQSHSVGVGGFGRTNRNWTIARKSQRGHAVTSKYWRPSKPKGADSTDIQFSPATQSPQTMLQIYRFIAACSVRRVNQRVGNSAPLVPKVQTVQTVQTTFCSLSVGEPWACSPRIALPRGRTPRTCGELDAPGFIASAFVFP